MESPRFENQSDAEDYIRELESKRQITAQELAETIEKYAGQTDWDNSPIRISELILSKYRVCEE